MIVLLINFALSFGIPKIHLNKTIDNKLNSNSFPKSFITSIECIQNCTDKCIGSLDQYNCFDICTINTCNNDLFFNHKTEYSKIYIINALIVGM